MRLDDVKILDLSQLLPGPYATQLLADMGAEIIKIERPDGGDPARRGAIKAEQTGGTFRSVNQGKESVVLDLKTAEGTDAFLRLATDADVVFEQFRPGVVDKLGIGYEDVRSHNPDIVYCSLSGFGGDGPYKARVGHDLNYISIGGLLDMNRRDEDSEPVIPGLPIADMAGGVFAALSITSALAAADRGEYIDLSMLDAVLSLAQPLAHEAFSGSNPRPGETRLTGRYPCYDIYRTADDRHLVLAALEHKFFKNFCNEIGCEHLIDNHLSDDPEIRTYVRDEIQSIIRTDTMESWEEQLGELDVMVAPVRRLEETIAGPHVEERGLISDGEHSRIVNPITRLADSNPPEDSLSDLGEDTVAVLSRNGFDPAEIRGLRAAGTIPDDGRRVDDD